MSPIDRKLEINDEIITAQLNEIIELLDNHGHDIAAAHVQLALDLYLGKILPQPSPQIRP